MEILTWVRIYEVNKPNGKPKSGVCLSLLKIHNQLALSIQFKQCVGAEPILLMLDANECIQVHSENVIWIGNLTWKCHLEFHNHREHQVFSEVIPLVNNQRLIVVYRKGQSPLLLIQLYPEDLFVTLIASFWYVLSYTSLTMPDLTWRVHCKSLWNFYCFRTNVFLCFLFFCFFLKFSRKPLTDHCNEEFVKERRSLHSVLFTVSTLRSK